MEKKKKSYYQNNKKYYGNKKKEEKITEEEKITYEKLVNARSNANEMENVDINFNSIGLMKIVAVSIVSVAIAFGGLLLFL